MFFVFFPKRQKGEAHKWVRVRGLCGGVGFDRRYRLAVHRSGAPVYLGDAASSILYVEEGGGGGGGRGGAVARCCGMCV